MLIFLENSNIGYLKSSWDYFRPQKFSEKKWTIYLRYFCVHLVYDLEFTTPCWSETHSLLHLNQL